MLLTLDAKILESECSVCLGILESCCKTTVTVGGKTACFRALLPNGHQAVIYRRQLIIGQDIRYKPDF